MTVYLVGAGPGDAGLLTARALELIAQADVIVHDRLIPPGALAMARPDAEVIDVGKRGGGRSAEQSEINRILLENASRHVVRLKGGDPFLFGRGGEEAEALAAEGVPFEVVPGVTAGIAAPAYAGIPVTHRDLASAVAFVTGHEDPAKGGTALNWEALAAFPGTLVIYMGVRQLPAIVRRLIAAGRDPEEPAVLIERGTLPDQRVLEGTLATLPSLDASPPAVVLIGPVAALRPRGAWLERRPLHGVSVAVTRAREQASGLAAELRSLGAAVVEAPAIRIVALEYSLPDLEPYDLICLTSPNGVARLFDGLTAVGLDARALAGRTVAAIGPGTAAALRSRGITADVVPERFVAEGLVEALADRPVRRALVARAAQARDALPEALRARGAEVDVLATYETRAESLTPEQLDAVSRSDYVTFTSSSTVRFLLAALGEDGDLSGRRLVSIGPVTSQELREHGLEPHVEAGRHDIPGLVEALLADAARPDR
ncbi:MAG: uroporphyrinogen-III C-methyltransferase [Solirubrobacteraceae bacterium]